MIYIPLGALALSSTTNTRAISDQEIDSYNIITCNKLFLHNTSGSAPVYVAFGSQVDKDNLSNVALILQPGDSVTMEDVWPRTVYVATDGTATLLRTVALR